MKMMVKELMKNMQLVGHRINFCDALNTRSTSSYYEEHRNLIQRARLLQEKCDAVIDVILWTS